MQTARARRAPAGVLAMLPLAVLLLSTLVWRDAPPRLPTHWSGALPDGFSAGSAFFTVVLTVAGTCAVLAALVAALSRLISDRWSRWILTALAGVAAGAAATYGSAVLGAQVAGDPAGVGTVWGLLPVLVFFGWSVLTYVVHGRRVPPLQEVLDQVPEQSRVGRVVNRAEPVRWGTTVASRLLAILTVFVLVTFAVAVALLAGDAPWWVSVLLVLLGLAGAGFAMAWSRVDLRVDDTGMSVRSDWMPLTLKRIEADQVVGVQVLDLDPMKWGGYGLRAVPDRTAYIVKGGPGIVVHQRDGRRFAVEITEGEDIARVGAAALLRAAGQAQAG